MKREYISREVAIKAIYASTVDTNPDHFTLDEYGKWQLHNGINIGITQAVLDVKSIPAADVVEVRHESWKDIGVMWIDKTNQPDGISTMFCPACERYATRIYYYGDPTDMMNYCPNCGAKMDLPEPPKEG